MHACMQKPVPTHQYTPFPTQPPPSNLHMLPAGKTPAPALQQQGKHLRCPPAAVWTRPTPDKDEDFTRPSYVPTPGGSPVIQPFRRDDQPLYTPSAPEFKPAELPEQQKEMPKGPTMPGGFEQQSLLANAWWSQWDCSYAHACNAVYFSLYCHARQWVCVKRHSTDLCCLAPLRCEWLIKALLLLQLAIPVQAGSALFCAVHFPAVTAKKTASSSSSSSSTKQRCTRRAHAV
jgi:hypothetical protein